MKNKYEILGIVGEGAYGIVYKCRNKDTGDLVAIKKFKETKDKIVQKTMKRELKMLQQLKHENVVELKESFSHKGNFFLVFEYIDKNLLEVLEKSPNGLSPKVIKSFIFQLCKALSYLHSKNMIHRDIKPENLLIDEKLNLKLCDFGFARKVKLNDNKTNINKMTDYVATRWYRSPELLLSGGIYGPDVDFWSVGCLMGELADGNPMFPGDNEIEQINYIIKMLGNLPDDLVKMFNNNPVFEGKKLLHVSEPESLEKKYKDKLSPTAIDFMKGLLQLDPKNRLNSETVFKHKYFAYYEKEIESHKNKEENILNKDSKNMIPIEKNKSAIESENKVSNEKKEAKNSYQKIKLNKHKKLNSSGITIDFKNYVMGNNLMQSKNLNSYNNANIIKYMK